MASSSSSSSYSTHRWIYDVFLSFRGEDTRRNFVSHRYSALSNAGVKTFIDDRNLVKGRNIDTLFNAVEGSQIAIVVFSKNYANSDWCLNELAQIIKCRRKFGQVVLPVFHGVRPSRVRRQKGYFGQRNNTYREWMSALTDATKLSGWVVSNYRTESDVIKEIVDEVLIKLDITYLSITDFSVGLEPRVQDVIQLLNRESRRACIVGIWGMGGIGKTTIAKAIYNQLRRNFQVKSFVENIREVWKKDRGDIDLQEQLLSEINKTKNVKIHSIEWGKTMIKDSLQGKKALVVLDDVDKFEQLNPLCGKHESIGPGSVIIITTRDVRILQELKVDYLYRTKEMNENESLELFSWHAFKKGSPREDFIELSRNVVTYCTGLPLALEVLGSYLYERTEQQWKSVLSKLERIPNNQVQEKLKISFDGLEDSMFRDIFLDICCFFIGKDRAYVTEILNGCELYADIGIQVLIERSLVKIVKNNKLAMHDLLRDMGREIVRERSPENPEKRCRLWFHEDALEVLRENTGTKAVVGLALKIQRASKVCFNTKAFEKMNRLRLLQLDHVQLAGDYEYLPKKLRWLYWHRFPLRYIPNAFNLGNVVAIGVKHSSLRKVWKEPQLLERLKILNLSHSRFLTNTPDFSKIPNLEKLILKDCPSLSMVHQSIGDLCNLLLINLKDCTTLRNLPRVVYKMKSVKTLILSGCSKIDKLEEDIVQMESLTSLIADFTGVKQVPFSIVRCKNIGYISLCGHEGLAQDVFHSLIWSWMSPTTNAIPRCIQRSSSMSESLVSIAVHNDNLDILLPMLSGLSKLRSVLVQCCSEFQLTDELRILLNDFCDVSFAELETTSYASEISENFTGYHLIGMGNYHQVINTLSNIIAEGLTSHGSSGFSLPGDNYPDWLAYTGEGYSVLFQVPLEGCHIKGMILSAVYSSTTQKMVAECLITVLIVNYTKLSMQISYHDEKWQSIISNIGPGDKVEIFPIFGYGVTVKRTNVYLIYSQSITAEMEPSPEVEIEPSPEVKIESSPELDIEPSPELEIEPSAELEIEPSAELAIEPSPEFGIEPSPELEIEPSPGVKREPSQKVKIEPSPELEIEPSPEVKIESSPELEIEPSPKMKMEQSPNVETEPIVKPEKNIVRRLVKRMGQCLCVNRSGGL